MHLSFHAKKCLKIGIPCLGEQSLLILSTTISAILIGHLGKNELIVSNMTTTVLNWMQSIFTGFSLALTVIISRYYNAKENTQKHYTAGLCLIVGFALLIALLAIIFSKPLTRLFYGDSLGNIAGAYFFLNMLALPLTALIQTVSAAARGTGDSVSGFISTLVLNIVNILLIYCFCYCGDAKGSAYYLTVAGISAVASRIVAAIVILLCTRKNPVTAKLQCKLPDKENMKNLLLFGLPIALENFIFRSALMMQQQIMIPLGETIQGGYQICTRVIDFVTAFTAAFQMTSVIIISAELGKKDFDNLNVYQKLLCRSTYLFFALYGICIYFFSPFLVELFTEGGTKLYESGLLITKSLSPVVLFLGIYNTYSGILRGGGDNRFITYVNNCSTLFGRVLLTYSLILTGASGYVALPLGFGVDFVIKSILCGIRLKKRKWMSIKV